MQNCKLTAKLHQRATQIYRKIAKRKLRHTSKQDETKIYFLEELSSVLCFLHSHLVKLLNRLRVTIEARQIPVRGSIFLSRVLECFLFEQQAEIFQLSHHAHR